MYCLRLLHDNHRPYIHPAGTMRESLFIHTAGGIAIQDYVPGLFWIIQRLKSERTTGS